MSQKQPPSKENKKYFSFLFLFPDDDGELAVTYIGIDENQEPYNFCVNCEKPVDEEEYFTYPINITYKDDKYPILLVHYFDSEKCMQEYEQNNDAIALTIQLGHLCCLALADVAPYAKYLEMTLYDSDTTEKDQ